MCMGSCWVVNGDEVVGFTFLLFAIEEAISGGRWIYIPVAVALVGLVNVFHLLSAVLLCLYVPARLFEIRGWRPAGYACLHSSCRLCLPRCWVGRCHLLWKRAIYFEQSSRVGHVGNFTWARTPSVFQLESARVLCDSRTATVFGGYARGRG